MTKAVLITNPAAARAGQAGLKKACARLAEGGLAVEVWATDAPGHAGTLARRAVDGGAELLIAHGGDGTIQEIAAVLIGTGLKLGLLPAGTGNLLAANLRIRRSPRAAADVILAGHARLVDAGRIVTSAGTRYFTVAAGAGFDAEVMHRTPQRGKRAFGIGAYVATAFRVAAALKRAHVRIETDAVTLEARAATVLVANCREIIPGVLPLGPDVEMDDGVLDVAVLDASSLPGAARVAWRLVSRQPHRDPGITFLRAHKVRITSDVDLPVQADGEACGRCPLSIEVVPGALSVLAPPRS